MRPRRPSAHGPALRRVAIIVTGLLAALASMSCSSSSVRAPERVSPDIRATTKVDRSEAVQSVEDWSFAKTPGQVIRTRHYRIFTTETNGAIVNRLPAFLEDALAQYRSALGPLPGPPMRLDAYLMDSRPQWQRMTLQLMGAEGEPYTKIGRGGFATRGVGVYYDLGLFDTFSIAAHEGWHQYTQRTFGEPLPVWLEEGVATFMEGHKWDRDAPIFLPWANIERFDQLRNAAANGSLRTLAELVETEPQDFLGRAGEAGVTWYAQLWALVHFLDEGEGGRYRDSLRSLLADAAAGRLARSLSVRMDPRKARMVVLRRGGADTLLAYCNPDLKAISREYDAFVQSIVSAGARDAIVAGRSPVARTSDAAP